MGLEELSIQLQKATFFLDDFIKDIRNGFVILPFSHKIITKPLWIDLYQHDIDKLNQISCVQLYNFICSCDPNYKKTPVQELANELSELNSEDLDFTINEAEKKLAQQQFDDFDSERKEDVQLKLIVLVHCIIAQFYNHLSQMINGRSLNNLLFSSKNISVHDAISAVKIDKSLISHDKVMHKIIDAQFNAGISTLKSIGNALSRPYFNKRVYYPKVYFAYYLLEVEGYFINGKFINITLKQVLDLLDNCNCFPIGARISSEEKLKRHIKQYLKHKPPIN